MRRFRSIGLRIPGPRRHFLNIAFADLPAPGELVRFSQGNVIGRQLGPTPTAVDSRVLLFPHPLFERLREQTEGLDIAAQDSLLEPAVVRGRGQRATTRASARRAAA